MTADEKKKTKEKMKEQERKSRVQQEVNERMRDVYEQARKLEGNGIHVELVPDDRVSKTPRSTEQKDSVQTGRIPQSGGRD